MNFPWWAAPTALFLVPLGIALLINLLVRHRRGIASNAVLAWFVIVCWIFAITVILRQVT